ncbi:helix-turn-helix domain-containing protein [uncultured Fibrella sp.]|uniref:helix-turn-helix domain-containing protein n=1 Tax=uncultured Fibrella sp. TaxID=1284596 RepID=UPI0035CB6906
MEMVLMPVADLRLMMIETASIAVRNNLPTSQATPPADEVLTIEQAAELLNLTKQTVYGMVSARKIPFCKPTGAQLYFLRSDLIDWLKQHRTATIQEATEAYNVQRTARQRRTSSSRSNS